MERHGVTDDTAFAMWLIKHCGVATVPGSSFYAHRDLGRTKIRFCFPKSDDLLREAGERLQTLRS
jgi:aminotransferase